MNIKIKRCGDIGMAEKHAYGLIVTIALYASCSKTMAQTMVFQPRDIKTLHQAVIVVAVRTRLSRFLLIGQYIEVCVYHLFQRFYHSQKFFGHGYLTA